MLGVVFAVMLGGCLLWSALIFPWLGSAVIIPCGLWSVAIIHGGVVVVGAPWFGLLLSCFGHVRAKNNSDLPCGLELYLILVWGFHPAIYTFITEL